ncbi:hypothetical protein DESUT3_38520 [Desulfuromonas versatilis]|uniref:Uncharacterized protein n=1 Tax=Desulfuromonas versatilis TaxID=2802975 RepID=A0ABM8HV38_9BACT|nr:hypothetical protein [Desulfuromonas versatilis]BCR06783.1 hypothetical protein DESUT3_38520 [Desulfuromonas versatilis]
MTIHLPLEQILGRNPKEVGKILRAQGIDPDLPYRATFTYTEVTIEQEPQPPRISSTH